MDSEKALSEYQSIFEVRTSYENVWKKKYVYEICENRLYWITKISSCFQVKVFVSFKYSKSILVKSDNVQKYVCFYQRFI